MAGRLTLFCSSYGINDLMQKVTIATTLSGRREGKANILTGGRYPTHLHVIQPVLTLGFLLLARFEFAS